ncbi:hypothetical protein FKM82_004424 [Ascaphus truei]
MLVSLLVVWMASRYFVTRLTNVAILALDTRWDVKQLWFLRDACGPSPELRSISCWSDCIVFKTSQSPFSRFGMPRLVVIYLSPLTKCLSSSIFRAKTLTSLLVSKRSKSVTGTNAKPFDRTLIWSSFRIVCVKLTILNVFGPSFKSIGAIFSPVSHDGTRAFWFLGTNFLPLLVLCQGCNNRWFAMSPLKKEPVFLVVYSVIRGLNDTLFLYWCW